MDWFAAATDDVIAFGGNSDNGVDGVYESCGATKPAVVPPMVWVRFKTRMTLPTKTGEGRDIDGRSGRSWEARLGDLVLFAPAPPVGVNCFALVVFPRISKK